MALPAEDFDDFELYNGDFDEDDLGEDVFDEEAFYLAYLTEDELEELTPEKALILGEQRYLEDFEEGLDDEDDDLYED
jgi:hypothetical protein